MTDLRVYLPATQALLRGLAERGELGPAPLTAFTVTAAVRALYPDGDDELWEFDALQDAAATAAEAGPLLVVSADVPTAHVTVLAADSAQVEVTAAVPVARVASLLVGDDVLGTGPAVVKDEEIELSWYDPSELPEVLRLLGA